MAWRQPAPNPCVPGIQNLRFSSENSCVTVNNWYRPSASAPHIGESIFIQIAPSALSENTCCFCIHCTAINHFSSGLGTRMLRQRVLSELRSSPFVRQGTSRSFQSLTHGRNVLPFLSSPKLTLREQLNLSSLAFKSQARVLATSAPTLGSARATVLKRRIARTLYKTATFTGFAGLTVAGLVVAFFIYDASTYKNEVDSYDVGVSELAMNPRRGGPKNLPIAETLVLTLFSLHHFTAYPNYCREYYRWMMKTVPKCKNRKTNPNSSS